MVDSFVRRLFSRQRIGNFFKRFAPLWIVWVLVWLLPPSHESARLHLWASPLNYSVESFDISSLFQGYDEDGTRDTLNPELLARRSPQNAGLAYWVFRHEQDRDNYNYYNSNRSPLSGTGAIQLAARFPQELWLQALPLRLQMYRPFDRYNYGFSGPQRMRFTNKERRALLALARQGQKREPNNAFWWLAEIYNPQDVTANLSANTSAILHRAARCTVYDDKSLETRRCYVRTQSAIRSLSWEEKLWLAVPTDGALQNWQAWGWAVRGLAHDDYANNRHAESLALSSALLRVGRLMRQGNNAPATALSGAYWQFYALHSYGSNNTISLQSFKLKRLDTVATRYANYSKGQGRADLGREALENAHELKVVWPWLNRPSNEINSFYDLYDTSNDSLKSRGRTFRSSGFLGLLMLCYLCAWWLVSNIFLWRASGLPSTRRDRVVPVLMLGTACVLLGLAVTWWLAQPHTPRPTRWYLYEAVIGSLGMFAALSPPFLLALWCSTLTSRRNRQALAMPSRLETELSLTPFSIKLLRWFWPTLVIVTAVGFVLSWVHWALATWLDWGMIDLEQLVFPNRVKTSGAWQWRSTDPLPLIYCAWLTPLLLVGWFWKWRYAAPALRPITQGGVRWWKETLGCAIVFVSSLYLATALLAWPTYHQLDTRIEQILERGELQFGPPFKSGR